MLVSVLGMITLDNAEQSQKADLGIDLIFAGKLMLFKAVHSLYAYLTY
jgi:hypothetical protein